MARRNSAPKINDRLASEFFSHRVNALIDAARYTYGLAEPFPVSDPIILGRYLDRAFGQPDLCDLASAGWAFMDRHVLAAGFYLPSDHPTMTERSLLGQCTMRTHQFEIDGVYLRLTMPSEYPGIVYDRHVIPNMWSGIGRAPSADTFATLRVRRLHAKASEEDSALAGRIRDWALRYVERREEVKRAQEFLATMLKCADGTQAFFKALPGLRGVVQTLGLHSAYLTEADRSYVGHNVFHTERATARVPMWRTAWADQHRPALLKAAASRTSESIEKRYAPDALFVAMPDRG